MFSMLFIMLKVKFIVLLFCIVSCSCLSKYCKICPNHVLCKYPMPGPSVSCKEYDKNTLFTDDEINDLVNQINERRNFIAMGHSKRLPRAANMKKVVWSEELATFAQRWVDQCDPSDKEDHCRDLENSKVGQNIASILNPSPEFNVKSFVEIWFIQSLGYTGSVSYYQFQDQSNKYFTQLIWAETESVGCGRAKFLVNNVIVERIVCNFSPKGNVYGKPLYAIGFPGTQCSNEMVPDEKFTGLCTRRSVPTKLTSAKPVSSLLRIRNLSNDSVKQEIDPIYNNVHQTNRNTNDIESSRHQIMRHILRNKVQLIRTDGPHRENFWERPSNVSRSNKDNSREKGHSRLYHSHVSRINDQPTKNVHHEGFKKFTLKINPLNSYSQSNYRKYNLNNQCTRSTENQANNDCNHSSTIAYNKNVYKCTRGLITSCKVLTETSESGQLCPCGSHRITYPTTNTINQYTLKCECENMNSVTISCPNLLRKDEGNPTTSSESYDNYSDKILYKDYLNSNDDNDWLLNKGRRDRPLKKRSGVDQSNRKIKQAEYKDLSTSKPFWEIDSFNNDRNSKLKSLRYTTLINKRRSKAKKYSQKSLSTESITIDLKNNKAAHVTEKYLSFDELLHLRKANLTKESARRKIYPAILRSPSEERDTPTESTTLEESTSEYTTNTPFIRLKHCTRRLTCTWTGAILTDSEGSIISGLHGQQGSRTPPGYVEGCTRTSTCTRDYMNRNVFPTSSTDSSAISEDDYDSDYCERRSLNVQKRNSSYERPYEKRSAKCINKSSSVKVHDDWRKMKILNRDNLKIKKRSYENNPQRRMDRKRKHSSSNISYGDLYYLVLYKIIGKWKNDRKSYSQCHCSRASKKHFTNVIMLFFLVIIFTL